MLDKYEIEKTQKGGCLIYTVLYEGHEVAFAEISYNFKPSISELRERISDKKPIFLLGIKRTDYEENPESPHKGIGSFLLHKIIENVKRRGYDSLVIANPRNQEVIDKFYRRVLQNLEIFQEEERFKWDGKPLTIYRDQRLINEEGPFARILTMDIFSEI